MERVEAEKELRKRGKQGDGSVQELENIIIELNRLKNTIGKENKSVKVYYPRAVIDTWSFSNSLGNELIEINDLYKKIKRKQ